MLHKRAALSCFALGCLLLSACEDDIPRAAAPGLGGGAAASSAAEADGARASAAGVAGGQTTFRDSDFVESDHNRDPFRSFDAELRAKVPVVAQRTVIMPNTPVDAMRLIAIVSGISQPRAMLVDERGVGYVTSRGDFVGKADVVQAGGADSLPVSLNWRVDRIRANEIVLAREDPSAPNRPPLTRVIALHETTTNADEFGNEQG